MLFFVPPERRQALAGAIEESYCASHSPSPIRVAMWWFMSPKRFTTNHWLASGILSMRSVPDVILLCGGAGLRLRSVIGNAPKGMAEVGRPSISGIVAAADTAARFRSRAF